MEKSLSFKITYWAYIEPVGVEDLHDIDEFKEEISLAYPGLVKALPSDRGGAAYQFMIEFICNAPLEEYLKIIGAYVAGKAVDKVAEPYLNKYLFDPLKKAYKKLKEKNKEWLDTYTFTFELSDTKIIIYKAGDADVMEQVNTIYEEIGKRYKELSWEGEFPYEIHIPALEDQREGKTFYRPPLGEDEHLQISGFDYTKGKWGLIILRRGLYCIYDLDTHSIDNEKKFLTEELMHQGAMDWI
jgi:hypothetical protein